MVGLHSSSRALLSKNWHLHVKPNLYKEKKRTPQRRCALHPATLCDLIQFMVRVHRIDTWLHSLRESCGACRKFGKHLRQRTSFDSCCLIEHQSSLYYNKTGSEGNNTTNMHGYTLCESTRRGPKGKGKTKINIQERTVRFYAPRTYYVEGQGRNFCSC